jgi:hypothetical protein
MQATHETYKFVNGTAYHRETPDAVIKWLETSRQNGQRIRIFYGDVDTGRDWMEEYDTMGRVSRTTGNVKVPILVRTERSSGGYVILDHRIVRITTKNSKGEIVDVYRHPNYHQPELKYHANPFPVLDREHPHEVHADGEVRARFKTEQQARRYIAFLKGERNSK